MTTTTAQEKLSLPRVLFEAARVKTLPAGVAPVILGGAVAYFLGRLDVVNTLLALTSTLLIQIGTNYANDYYDFKSGADTEERIGPRRATQAGLLTPQTMKRAFIIAFALAVAIGAVLVLRTSYMLVVVGILSVLSGILYTGGPRPLGYLGLGDVFVLIFFGPVAVAGTTFVSLGRVDVHAVVFGFASGLLSTAILVVNNLRDRETDVKANKRTLAVRFGPSFVRAEYGLCLCGALVISVVESVMLKEPTIACAVLLIPLFINRYRQVQTTDGRALNPLLGKTAQLLLFYVILTTVGLVVARAY